MADDDAIKKLEARLTRLEATLAQQPSGAGAATAALPSGAVVDPAPWGGGGWGGWGGWGRPHPIVDPAVFAGSGRWPGAVVDPVPWPGGGVVDPAAFAGAAQARAAATLGRVGPIGDPPPIDVSRFSVAQLEATLHSINAEKSRLASMETMVTQQLGKLKGQQG
jgi:hypothetical protein